MRVNRLLQKTWKKIFKKVLNLRKNLALYHEKEIKTAKRKGKAYCNPKGGVIYSHPYGREKNYAIKFEESRVMIQTWT